jgi:LacI family transcriptional regulator
MNNLAAVSTDRSRTGSSVTLRDVARRAAVHPGTVSRALNEETRALVNQATAQRVIDAAEELGYKPNPIARGLKTNRSYTVGVLIPDLTNPLFPPIVRGIEDRLGEAGYTSLIANTENDPERERADVLALRTRQVDGFIAATARHDHELLAEMAAAGERVVLVNRRLADGSLPAVTGDDREGMRLAVEHITGLGHTRVAHLGGPASRPTPSWCASGAPSPRPRARGPVASCSMTGRLSRRSSPATTSWRSGATTCSRSADCCVPPTCR